MPRERAGELARFDGSVIVERTKDEVSALLRHGGKQSFRLMHEIVTSKRTAEDARKFDSETTAAYAMNRAAPHTPIRSRMGRARGHAAASGSPPRPGGRSADGLRSPWPNRPPPQSGVDAFTMLRGNPSISAQISPE